MLNNHELISEPILEQILEPLLLTPNSFCLRRLILIDAYRQGALTELKLDGHTSITGANGIGKTSLLRLIPLFYGESPNRLVRGGGAGQSFVSYYLPHTTSFIAFEYSRYGKICMVVMHASSSGESVHYRFIDQPFDLTRFQDAEGNLINGSDLNRHIKKRGEFCSEQITALIDYRAIIQNSASTNRDHRRLAASFAFVGAGSRLSHVEKIVTGMFSRVTSFRDIKSIIVSCIADGKTSIRLESSNSMLKSWVREYRAYTSVMAQADQMRDFQTTEIRHNEAARQLQVVHIGFTGLQLTQERALAQARQSIERIQNERHKAEEVNQKQINELSHQLGEANGNAGVIVSELQALHDQRVRYDQEGLHDFAKLVDTLPQLTEAMVAAESREKALLGLESDLGNSYAELRTRRTEAFHELERGKNTLKEPIRTRGKESEASVRLAGVSSWQVIESDLERQHEVLVAGLEALSERVGGLKQAVANPQPSDELVKKLETARDVLDTANKQSAKMLQLHEQAKRDWKDEIAALQSLDKQIQAVREQEQQKQIELGRLISMRDAAPGTLLNFLREFKPDWTQNIARVIPESFLLRKDLAPTLVNTEALSLYGIGLDLAVLDTPGVGEEAALQHLIDEAGFTIDRHQVEVKAKEVQRDQQSERGHKAKTTADESYRSHIQTENELKSCRTTYESCQRALNEDRRQATRRAEQQLQEVMSALTQSKNELEQFKSSRKVRKNQHEAELNRQLTTIDAQIQAELTQIDQVILAAKSSCDHDIGVLNQELRSALKERGVDTDSLDKLKQEKSKVKEQLLKARGSEARVGDWRRWMEVESTLRPELEKSLSLLQAKSKHIAEELTLGKKHHETQMGELNKDLNNKRLEMSNLEKLHGYVLKRLEKLSKWPVASLETYQAEIMAKPSTEQDVLEMEMDRLLKEIQIEESKGRALLASIKQVFFCAPGTTPYQYYESKRLNLGPDQDSASPFIWIEPMRSWFEAENDNSRRLLLSQSRNFASGIHEFHDNLNRFKRQVGIFSKDLHDNMAASTRFRFINSVTVRITTTFDSLDGWEKIRQLDDAYGIWVGSDTGSLPGSDFADAVDEVSDWLQGRHSLDVKLEDLIGLEIDIEEAGQSRKTVRDEGQLRDASSNGLSYLILCVVFVGLINKIRAGQPIQLVWALDELRDLDINNVQTLLTMLTDNHIHLVSAFPDADSDISALMKNCYIIQEGRRLVLCQQNMEIDIAMDAYEDVDIDIGTGVAINEVMKLTADKGNDHV